MKSLNHFSKFSVACFLFAGASQGVNAIEFSPDNYLFPAEEKPQYLSWLPGERYDPRSGRMGHSIVDMEVKGNRLLPIVIRRTSGSGNQGHFGNMSLDLPRIATTENTAGLAAVCAGYDTQSHTRAPFYGPPRASSPISFVYGD